MLWSYLFAAIKLTKNTTVFDKCKYFGCGIGFDTHRSFSLSDGSRVDKNIIIFDTDVSSSAHVDKRSKRYLNYW